MMASLAFVARGISNPGIMRESEMDRVARRLKGKKAVSAASTIALEFAEAQWLEESEAGRLCVVIEEWISNLYDHGKLTLKDEVELVLACDPEGIRVTITDPGPPFDPRDYEAGDDPPERGGGVGIDIIRAWAEFESYSRVDGGNQLTLMLPIHWGSSR